MAEARSSNNLVGTAGEYFVCAELCRIGYLALLTPKNNPIFDIIASRQDGSRSVAIQVKTRSIHNKQGWKLGKDITNKKNNEDLFIVLVNLEEGMPEFYVYEYDALAVRVQRNYEAYINTPKRDGGKKKEVGFRWHDTKYFESDDHSRLNNWMPIIETLKKS
ncbi:MAG: aspartate-ammonia lyase [Candidatus Sedimenticola sp. (ex Thyasira tokunagai)]